MSILRSVLPDVVPDEEILVEEEPHLFRETEYEDGTTQSQEKYILDKAPVKTVENVYGEVNGSQQDFTAGEDYELSDDKTTIDFSIGGNSPDGNTEFYVTYRCRSIIDRYIESHEEILEEVDEKRDKAIAANFVEQAQGQELDEIGRLFGEVGKRNGRDDERYRIYLKSIARSFISRGTISGIKEAISIATEVPVEDITIEEDFENNKYRVDVVPNTPVTGSLLEEVADIADPSGVEQSGTTFTIPAERVDVSDILVVEGGQKSEDKTDVSDKTKNFGFGTEGATFEDIYVYGNVSINSNKNSVDKDSVSASDALLISPNDTKSFDDIVVDESLDFNQSHKNAHRWESNRKSSTTEWDFFEWTELRDLIRETLDVAYLDDEASTRPKAAVNTDVLYSDDGVSFVFNTGATSDTIVSGDAASLPSSRGNTVDVSLSDDSVSETYQQEVLYWEESQWGADWAGSVGDGEIDGIFPLSRKAQDEKVVAQDGVSSVEQTDVMIWENRDWGLNWAGSA